MQTTVPRRGTSIPMGNEVSYLILALCVYDVVYSCIFPVRFQGQPWHTHIRASTRSVINFRGGVMEYHEEDTRNSSSIRTVTERHCMHMVDGEKFVIAYRNQTYGCIQFVIRSLSVVQLKVSKAFHEYSTSLCDERNLTFNPWLMISINNFNKEFITCPFTGGYNMKIKDRNGVDHGCNFIDLPMRFESECFNGESILFDFRKPSCIGELPMAQYQRAICVTHWRIDGDVVIVLKKSEANIPWVIRIPARKSFTETTTIYLFTDFIYLPVDIDTRYFQLELEMVTQNTLCMDELKNCQRLPCLKYFEPHCLSTCGKCDPHVYPTSCEFPKTLQGDWFVNDNMGVASVNISESRIAISRVGSFDCITFFDSPSRGTNYFTAVTYFNSGCRPHYTCLAFKILNSNLIGYMLSQSMVWPLKGYDHVGSSVCSIDNFQNDPAPILDSFRTYKSSFKLLMTSNETVTKQRCLLESAYEFNATSKDSGTCSGEFYQNCNESSHVRFYFNNCPFSDTYLDFTCVGILEGKYWEKVVLMQNIASKYDTRCLIFSYVEPTKVFMLPIGECDELSWTHVNAGLRKTILDLTVRPVAVQCKTISTIIITSNANTTTLGPLKDAWILEDNEKLSTNKSFQIINNALFSNAYRQESVTTRILNVHLKDQMDPNMSTLLVNSEPSNTLKIIHCVSNVCVYYVMLSAYFVRNFICCW